jgi:hypothetical protein
VGRHSCLARLQHHYYQLNFLHFQSRISFTLVIEVQLNFDKRDSNINTALTTRPTADADDYNVNAMYLFMDILKHHFVTTNLASIL